MRGSVQADRGQARLLPRLLQQAPPGKAILKPLALQAQVASLFSLFFSDLRIVGLRIPDRLNVPEFQTSNTLN
jgi:hypothetical protein